MFEILPTIHISSSSHMLPLFICCSTVSDFRHLENKCPRNVNYKSESFIVYSLGAAFQFIESTPELQQKLLSRVALPSGHVGNFVQLFNYSRLIHIPLCPISGPISFPWGAALPVTTRVWVILSCSLAPSSARRTRSRQRHRWSRARSWDSRTPRMWVSLLSALCRLTATTQS